MKRRLLFLFAVFMVATSVGWGQTDLYVSTSGSDGNGGGVEAPLATIAKAIEKAADGYHSCGKGNLSPSFTYCYSKVYYNYWQ